MTSTKSARVSICLPVFNGEPFLSTAIESVLEQTFSDFELIIIDDCSTDNSLKIIKEYAAIDQRIKHSSNNKNAGLFGNYNLCIEASSGEYIKPFAQDDLLHSDMLEKMVAVLDAFPEVAMVGSSRTPICPKGKRITSVTPLTTASSYLDVSRSVSGREVIKKSLNPVVNFIGEPTAVIFRKEHAGSGFDSTYYHLGDLEYWFRILLNGRFAYVDEELCSFRIHSASTTATNRKFMLYAADMLRLGRQYKRFIWEAGRTQPQYNDDVINCLVSDLQARGEPFKDSLLALEPDYLSDFSAHVANQPQPSLPVGLLEVALQALLRVSEPRPEPVVTTQYAVISSLEDSLRSYLSSPSWRLTRFLRDLNSMFLDRDPELKGPQSEDLRSYERHLRKLLKRVKASRSWRVSQPFRVIARLVHAGLIEPFYKLAKVEHLTLAPFGRQK